MKIARLVMKNRFMPNPPNSMRVTRSSKWGNPHKCEPKDPEARDKAAKDYEQDFPEQGHGGDRKSNKNQTPKIGFETFASQSFKVGERYAKQALKETGKGLSRSRIPQNYRPFSWLGCHGNYLLEIANREAA